jgi:hypothetical protein
VTILKYIKTDERTQRQFLLAEDLDRLERAVQKIGDVGLITIDPITAYMGGKMDSYKATEVRSQLGPLKDFAECLNIAVSTITHPAKGAGPRALDHFIGSQAFIAACRVGHLFIAETVELNGERVPTGRVLFTNVRNAAHSFMPTLVYRKEEFTVSTEPYITAPRLIWEGTVNITAEAAIAAAADCETPRVPARSGLAFAGRMQALKRIIVRPPKRMTSRPRFRRTYGGHTGATGRRAIALPRDRFAAARPGRATALERRASTYSRSTSLGPDRVSVELATIGYDVGYSPATVALSGGSIHSRRSRRLAFIGTSQPYLSKVSAWASALFRSRMPRGPKT